MYVTGGFGGYAIDREDLGRNLILIGDERCEKRGEREMEMKRR